MLGGSGPERSWAQPISGAVLWLAKWIEFMAPRSCETGIGSSSISATNGIDESYGLSATNLNNGQSTYALPIGDGARPSEARSRRSCSEQAKAATRAIECCRGMMSSSRMSRHLRIGMVDPIWIAIAGVVSFYRTKVLRRTLGLSKIGC